MAESSPPQVSERTSHPLPQQMFTPEGPLVSRVALGCMGLSGVRNPADIGAEHRRRAIASFESALDVGITFFDHADIYGGGSCEAIFHDCLKAVPGARERIFIATKCGIRPGHYNLSPQYILDALERSLERLGTDHIDLYQMHRPDPLTHPAETARALNELLRREKIRYIGVSNYYPEQIRALQVYLDAPIRSNQISISLRRLEPIYDDGTLDQCMALRMTPLAYSPVARGALAGRGRPDDDPVLAGLVRELQQQAENYNATATQIAIAWLLALPSEVIPIVGSNDPDHIREAAGAGVVTLKSEDWYRLWVAARGKNIP